MTLAGVYVVLRRPGKDGKLKNKTQFVPLTKKAASNGKTHKGGKKKPCRCAHAAARARYHASKT